MKLKGAMIKAGEDGEITRPTWPIYPRGVKVETCLDHNGDEELFIECDISISDLDADDYEIVF